MEGMADLAVTSRAAEALLARIEPAGPRCWAMPLISHRRWGLPRRRIRRIELYDFRVQLAAGGSPLPWRDRLHGGQSSGSGRWASCRRSAASPRAAGHASSVRWSRRRAAPIWRPWSHCAGVTPAGHSQTASFVGSRTSAGRNGLNVVIGRGGQVAHVARR